MASRKTSPRKTAVFRLEGAEENGTKAVRVLCNVCASSVADCFTIKTRRGIYTSCERCGWAPKIRLTETQIRALRAFAGARGHAYGEFAHLSRPTAQRLSDLGLVKLGRECVGWGKRSVPWGWVTDAGRAFLARLDATR